MNSDAEKNDTPKVKVQYTYDFLRSLSHVKLEPQESVKNSELYIYAPKPTVHRPRVDRSSSRGVSGHRSFLPAAERLELQRRRKAGEKSRVVPAGKENRAPNTQHVTIGQKVRQPPTVPESDNQAENRPVEAEAAVTVQDAELPVPSQDVSPDDTTAAVLMDANEQALLLSVPDPEGPGLANKPEARSLLQRTGGTPAKMKPPAIETDERRLEQRLKQIEYGKVTQGYKNYLAQRPKEKRLKRDPQTPNAWQKCSKRSWDGQVRKWRQQLHKYDDPPGTESNHGTNANLTRETGPPNVQQQQSAPQPPVSTPVGTPAKTPMVSKEERDELARKRKELEELRTPKNTAHVHDTDSGDKETPETLETKAPADGTSAVVAEKV
eukprot:CAMPEP_0174280612 /NCGR_PEP_ID=MMETSP0809-20121228/893_1 /TAXON_ID=73025 ORGANISM="Eutreptiella gymnastica-like, Strain CCMP1594" /NCGR_SAMPLE_ID=MMETSP0809 /ASSEMBLY_ACC=CAM_ASM_000658 /LENGTH=379 /DNA_ID=CAMNT_0015373605 /DNA_START=58 /DNA_END=1197 /DNA_ORIENTATION=+